MRQRWSGADKFAQVLGFLLTLLFIARPAASSSNSRSDLQTQETAPKALATYAGKPRASYSESLYGAIEPRKIHEYQQSDFILLAEVDGSLSARDRKTGKQKWELVTQEPAVKTTYHRANVTASTNEPSARKRDPDDLLEWFVGPTEDGELFYYTPESGMEKLAFTIKDIINTTPYKPPGSNKVFNGQKTTVTYAINARTGMIERIFSADGLHGPVNGKKCKISRSGFKGEDCELDSEVDDGIIMIGRTEYTVTIQNWSTGENLWTIKFNEWTPNTSDLDLRAQHDTPFDNRYVYSHHDGTIFVFDKGETPDGERRPIFTAKLDSPVVRVFDVLSHQTAKELVILPQPPFQLDDFNVDSLDRTYIGATENGAWFALSEAYFPYVTENAAGASCYKEDEHAWPSLLQHERRSLLIGTHKVHDGPRQHIANIPYYKNTRKIAGSDGAVYSVPGKKFLSSKASYPTQESDVANIVESSWTFGSMGPQWLLVAVIAGYLFWHKPGVMRPGDFKLDAEGMRLAPRAVVDKPDNLTVLDAAGRPVASSGSEEEEESVIEIVNRRASVAESGPVEVEGEVRVTTPELVAEPVTTIPEPPTTSLAVEDAVTVPVVPETAEKALPKPHAIDEAPQVEIENDAETAKPRIVDFQDAKNSDTEAAPTETRESPDETPKKKKYARGRRGGKKKNKNKNAATEAEPAVAVNIDPFTVVEELEVVAEIPPAVGAPAETQVVLHDMTKKLGEIGPNKVDLDRHQNYVQNRLEVFEGELIGSGSQGTTVHRGLWEGRVVAVKRLLIAHQDVALKEVRVLQEADYHENIVRYYCLQSQGSFFYIALECCPCSLGDLITERDKHHKIRERYDPRDCIAQIARGLEHLHSLKMVHRDIKPQNVLVGEPLPNTNTPRYLISDFGLCKKLLPEETQFANATMTHLGTVGWRAPELLVAPETSLSILQDKGSSSSEEDTIELPTAAKHTTRAIDIFAFGCLCFYVITGGKHPFGVSYRRELNIVEGRPNLAPLEDSSHGLGFETADLVRSMIQQNPLARPKAIQLQSHPFFWKPSKRLKFVCLFSDMFEKIKDEQKDAALAKLKPPPSRTARGSFSTTTSSPRTKPLLPPQPVWELETGSPDVIGENWIHRLCPDMYDELVAQKRRGYDGTLILDLCRAIRNKSNHWDDMTPAARRATGEVPREFWGYWEMRFPRLLMHLYTVIKRRWRVYGEERERRLFVEPGWVQDPACLDPVGKFEEFFGGREEV